MEYLEILVFALCATFVVSQGEKGPFVCPVCAAEGENAEADCEANIKNKTCPGDEPVCALTVNGPHAYLKFRRRDCYNRQQFKRQKDFCDDYGTCAMAMCDSSGCKAELPAPAPPIKCPVCSAEGENADSECEATIENKMCKEVDPVCTLAINTPSQPNKFKNRQCMSRQSYEKFKDNCKKSQYCIMTMCDTDGCKAEFPAEGPFMCPACNAEGKNADTVCEAEIKNQYCAEDEPVCALTVSTPASFFGKYKIRECLSKEVYEQSKADCDLFGNCIMASCGKYGCKAEIPASDSPGPFMCPTCSAEGENAHTICEAKIENQNCAENVHEPVCALTVNRPQSSRKYMARECVSRKDYEHSKRYCDTIGGCLMASCDTSGCKAEIPASDSPGPFMCPTCSAEGENAHTICEAKIENQNCAEDVHEPVCALTVNRPQSSRKYMARECVSREDYEHSKRYCDTIGGCLMASCDTSGCKANIPA